MTLPPPSLPLPSPQIFSTVYSVLRNPSNALSVEMWAGCGLVFLGLLIELIESALHKKKPKADVKKAQ